MRKLIIGIFIEDDDADTRLQLTNMLKKSQGPYPHSCSLHGALEGSMNKTDGKLTEFVYHAKPEVTVKITGTDLLEISISVELSGQSRFKQDPMIQEIVEHMQLSTEVAENYQDVISNLSKTIVQSLNLSDDAKSKVSISTRKSTLMITDVVAVSAISKVLENLLQSCNDDEDEDDGDEGRFRCLVPDCFLNQMYPLADLTEDSEEQRDSDSDREFAPPDAWDVEMDSSSSGMSDSQSPSSSESEEYAEPRQPRHLQLVHDAQCAHWLDDEALSVLAVLLDLLISLEAFSYSKIFLEKPDHDTLVQKIGRFVFSVMTEKMWASLIQSLVNKINANEQKTDTYHDDESSTLDNDFWKQVYRLVKKNATTPPLEHRFQEAELLLSESPHNSKITQPQLSMAKTNVLTSITQVCKNLSRLALHSPRAEIQAFEWLKKTSIFANQIATILDDPGEAALSHHAQIFAEMQDCMIQMFEKDRLHNAMSHADEILLRWGQQYSQCLPEQLVDEEDPFKAFANAIAQANLSSAGNNEETPGCQFLQGHFVVEDEDVEDEDEDESE